MAQLSVLAVWPLELNLQSLVCCSVLPFMRMSLNHSTADLINIIILRGLNKRAISFDREVKILISLIIVYLWIYKWCKQKAQDFHALRHELLNFITHWYILLLFFVLSSVATGANITSNFTELDVNIDPTSLKTYEDEVEGNDRKLFTLEWKD